MENLLEDAVTVVGVAGAAMLTSAFALDEGTEAEVLLVAGLAALEVRAHAGDQLVGAAAALPELELDVAVELLEALLAAQLGAGRPEQASQGVVGSMRGGVHVASRA
jgi:hypothetical protein